MNYLFRFLLYNIKYFNNWIELSRVTGVHDQWHQVIVPLAQCLGADRTSVLMRLRLVTDTGRISEPFTGWFLDDIVLLGDGEHTLINGDYLSQPLLYDLEQNYPNPFNTQTTLSVQLPKSGWVGLEIYNILGQKIATLINQRLETGLYRAIRKGKNDAGYDVAAGVYLAVMKAGFFTQSRKILLMK